MAGVRPDAVEPLGRVGPRGAVGLPDASEPRGAAPLDGAVLLDVVGPHVCGGPPAEAGPRGGVGFLVGPERLAAFARPAAWRRRDAAARRATGPPRAAASLASEPPAFGLWPHHSEDSAGCQMWG